MLIITTTDLIKFEAKFSW